MKVFLYTTISLLVTSATLLAQTSTTAVTKETIEIVKDNGDDLKEVKSVCKTVKTSDNSPKRGKLVIKTIDKNGVLSEKHIDILDGNEADIDHLIDSLTSGDFKDIDINVEFDDFDFSDISKIQVIKMPGNMGENIWFEGAEGGNGIEWIDIDDISEFAEIQAAEATRPFLGVILDDEDNDDEGIRVISVVESGAAQAAGIEKEDIIIALDNKAVNSLSDLGSVLREKNIGEAIEIDLLRNDKEKTVTAILKSKAECDFNLSNSFHFKTPACCAGDKSCSHHQRTYKALTSKPKPKLGVNIENLDSEMITDLKIKNGKGVLITKVYSESAASKIGLKVNDVITKINGTPINEIKDLHDFLSEQKLGEEIAITYYRYGKVKTSKGVLFEFNDYQFNFNN